MVANSIRSVSVGSGIQDTDGEHRTGGDEKNREAAGRQEESLRGEVGADGEVEGPGTRAGRERGEGKAVEKESCPMRRVRWPSKHVDEKKRGLLMKRASVRPGPGSMRLLDWLARLGVAGFEPLGLALGLSQRVVYDHVARLARDGLVERKVTGDGEGGVVALTRAGARVAFDHGVSGVVRPQSTAPGSARHGRAVSWVAASADLRGWRWLGPAELRAEPGWRVAREDGARHLPDLGLMIRGQRVAVEVELHRKAPKRLQAILRGYRGLIDLAGLGGVSYVVDRADVGALVRREADEALLGSKLQVGGLDELITRSRRAGVARRAVPA